MRRIADDYDLALAIRLGDLRLHLPRDAAEKVERNIATERYADDLATSLRCEGLASMYCGLSESATITMSRLGLEGTHVILVQQHLVSAEIIRYHHALYRRVHDPVQHGRALLDYRIEVGAEVKAHHLRCTISSIERLLMIKRQTHAHPARPARSLPLAVPWNSFRRPQ